MTVQQQRVKEVRQRLIEARRHYKAVEAERNALVVELGQTATVEQLVKLFGMKSYSIEKILADNPSPTDNWSYK